MFNLLNAELYKLSKSKVFLICGIVIIAYVLLLYGMLHLAQKIDEREVERGTNGVEVQEGSTDDSFQDFGVIDVERVMFITITGLITAIFACVFVIGEFGNGAVKNTVGKGIPRHKIFIAKYMLTVAGAVILMIISAVTVMLAGFVFFGTDGMNRIFFKNLIQYSGLQILLGAAFVGIVIAVGEFTRNLGVGISVSLVTFMLGGFLFAGLDLLFNGLDFQPSMYWIISIASNCPVDGLQKDYVMRAVTSAFVWSVVSMLLGMLHFKKVDIE